MSISGTKARLLTGAYSAVRQSGVLQTRLGKQAFARSYFLYKRFLEDPFQRLAQRYPELFRGGDVLDVGANIGYTAAVFARAIDPGRNVYAFEPEPFNFQLLENAAKRRDARGKIVPLQCAVGAEDGHVDLWLNMSHHADHRVATEEYRSHCAGEPTVRVPLTTIDTFWGARPGVVGFIKIDVQGYELAVCRGMSRTVAAHPDAVIAVEYMPDALRELGFDPEILLAWFRERHYHPYALRNNGTLGAGTPADLPVGGYVDLLFSRSPLRPDDQKLV